MVALTKYMSKRCGSNLAAILSNAALLVAASKALARSEGMSAESIMVSKSVLFDRAETFSESVVDFMDEVDDENVDNETPHTILMRHCGSIAHQLVPAFFEMARQDQACVHRVLCPGAAWLVCSW